MIYRNQTALITGASSGIGAEFARALARRGSDLIVVARSQDKLRALAAELAEKHGVSVHVIAQDLSEEWAARAVFEQVESRGLRVDILVNNAGFATQGDFAASDAERVHREVMLNALAVVDLTRAFLPAMVERKRGAIINVASVAAFLPLPTQAVYGGTKAFVLSWSDALWAENRERGIKVLALCPGATETDFFQVVGKPMNTAKDSPQFVVRAALRALSRGDNYLVPGRGNWLVANLLPRLLPRRQLVVQAGRVMKKFWESGG